MSQLIMAEIQKIFEIDYKTKATATSIIAKLLEVKQAADETENKYFSRAKKILCELKSNNTNSELREQLNTSSKNK
jgi:hypothetical protein